VRQLQSCRLNHVSCGATTSSSRGESVHVDACCKEQAHPVLPTRLLDLGQSNSDIRLLEPSPGARGEYACLSHCWGGNQPIKTTSENIDMLRAGPILWKYIPITFQHAISFTRSLNLRYLWIDSLCIIQDDRDDWSKEAANMASIYRNSTILLSATASANCHVGLFFENDKRKPPTLYTSENHKIIMRPRIRHWSDHSRNNNFKAEEWHQAYPLLSRAWAYQERLLAPRVLHFCKTELVWECNEHFSCQCGNYEPLIDHPKTAITNILSWKEERQQIEPETKISSGVENWHRIVHQYSKCKLTFEKDRLPALAGLAEQVQATRKGRYLAGLWEDSLIVDLAWERLPTTKSMSKNLISSSPTWSWSTVREEMWFPQSTSYCWTTIKQLCEIVDVNYVPMNSSNPRGEVVHARLSIRGHVIEATLTDGMIKFLGTVQEVECILDYDVSLPGLGNIAKGSKVFCLTLSTTEYCIYSLVLRCTNLKMNTYERVGLMCCKMYGVGVGLFPRAWRSSQDSVGTEAEVYRLYRSFASPETDFVAQSLNQANILTMVDRGPCLVRLTSEQIATAKSHNPKRSFPSPLRASGITPLDDPDEGRWYLPPNEAEKKVRGEEHKECYLGKIINLV
jgi:hypothetical protein